MVYCWRKSRRYPYVTPELAVWLTLISSHYLCLEHIFMVPKVFEPLKFYCSFLPNTHHWLGWLINIRLSNCRGNMGIHFSWVLIPTSNYQLISILFYPITLEGGRGTTDEFATIPFHLDLFAAALVELEKSIPVHSLILSSNLFFCLPIFLFPFTVPCRIVFAKPEDLETWPNYLSFRFLTRVRSSSYSPMAAWIFLRTSSLVTWSLYEMFNSLR